MRGEVTCPVAQLGSEPGLYLQPPPLSLAAPYLFTWTLLGLICPVYKLQDQFSVDIGNKHGTSPPDILVVGLLPSQTFECRTVTVL